VKNKLVDFVVQQNLVLFTTILEDPIKWVICKIISHASNFLSDKTSHNKIYDNLKIK
jgi:hypothetical protein